MLLYHYTTFSNFCSIWIQQKLKFSGWTNCNDVFEREKIYNFTLQSRIYEGKKCSKEAFRRFYENVFDEIEQYKQVSFCIDDSRYDIPGYAFPVMWGHYARDYQRSGVCIEIDSSKIKWTGKAKVYKKKVCYNKILLPTHVGGVNAEKADAAHEFIIKNKDNLFFRKHIHWRHENEFRFVSRCKDDECLDISGAVTGVYVLGEDDITVQAVRRMVLDTDKISFLNVGFKVSKLSLNPMNLFEYDELQEFMKQMNSEQP